VSVPVHPISTNPAREQEELAAYLGSDFRLDRLTTYQHTLAQEFADCGDEASFYRTSEGYLYNLTAFAMTGTKIPYLRALTRLVPPGGLVLDYGCGIGSDGLLLLEAGYRVEFADFDNPSTRYLRWRLEHRGLEAPVHDIDRNVPVGFDAVFSFDVIEHVEDPRAFLAELEDCADLVLVNLLRDDDQEIHHELPIEGILKRAAARRIRYYRVFGYRSHLVGYDATARGTAADRLASATRLLLGRQANRLRFHSARLLGRLPQSQGG